MRPRLAPHFLLPAGSAAVVVVLLALVGRHPVAIASSIHLLAVASSAAAAALASIVLTVVGARRHDGRATLVGTGFSVMAAILAVHGLSTPSVLFDRNSVTSFSGAATLPIGGLILALSALPGLRRPRNPRPLLGLQALLLLAVAAAGVAAGAAPVLLPRPPAVDSTGAFVTLGVVLVLYGILAVRTSRTFALTRRLNDLVAVCGVVLLTGAVVASFTLGWPRLGVRRAHLRSRLPRCVDARARAGAAARGDRHGVLRKLRRGAGRGRRRAAAARGLKSRQRVLRRSVVAPSPSAMSAAPTMIAASRATAPPVSPRVAARASAS